VWESVISQVSYHMMSYDRHGKEVHKPCSSCISSIEKSNRNFIEFSLSITKQRVVGLILAWSLAFLQWPCSDSNLDVINKSLPSRYDIILIENIF